MFFLLCCRSVSRMSEDSTPVSTSSSSSSSGTSSVPGTAAGGGAGGGLERRRSSKIRGLSKQDEVEDPVDEDTSPSSEASDATIVPNTSE